jgi:transcription elongation factor Elf1
MQIEATITCPECQHEATETMPTDACQFFYACKGCGTRLKPLAAIAACSALTAPHRARPSKRERQQRVL